MSQKALEGSIKKWKRIVRDARAIDSGGLNCPLCEEYLDDGCQDCPVYIRIGDHCFGSPWGKWVDHQSEAHAEHSDRHRVPYCKECMRLAKAELTFLESLRKTEGE